MDRSILKTPFIEFLTWFFVKLKTEHRNKTAKIGYMAKIHNLKLGKYNKISNYSVIVNSSLDDYSYIGSNCLISETEIGKFCSIGSEVVINLAKHPTHLLSTHPAFYSTGGHVGITFVSENKFKEFGHVVIGNDVWIGTRSMIMADLKIGNGAIIAAGAIVTHDVEPYSIVGGIPARVIRKRFTEDQIKEIEMGEWWNKSKDWYISHIDCFHKSISDLSECSNSLF